ncbi:hypothetical protein [Octadecabacter ascidiaceicola]|uniref:Uncharacterized protein n=1 Tax=Octadecabacter ascidiaceicola TaxID=1655543 RepID=A0A238JU93_9RHOB|nr:hypothetical protein [Octadecabacter ascidiaceicola]SMX33764.1 hypothetical protein OCA8868_01016 [Octadecabacter ascidiaceicola]
MLAKKDDAGKHATKVAVDNVKELPSVAIEADSAPARLQLILPSQSMARLTSIKDVTEAASYAEVIRRSLRIYEGLLAEVLDGSSVVVRRTDGSEECLPIATVL